VVHRDIKLENILVHEIADHLYWPQLDVDLSVASLRKPDHFPLLARVTA